MVLGSPFAPTALATTPSRDSLRISASPMGGGDRASDTDSLFGSPRPRTSRGSASTDLVARNGRGGLRARPLRRASPAPFPLSQYPTPPKKGKQEDGKLQRTDQKSPTSEALGRSIAIESAQLAVADSPNTLKKDCDVENGEQHRVSVVTQYLHTEILHVNVRSSFHGDSWPAVPRTSSRWCV